MTARLTRFLAAMALAASPPAFAQGGARLPILGAIEDVLIEPGGIPMRAKVDTGADNSSLGVQHLRRMRRKGKPWVAFEITAQDGSRRSVELAVLRRATIRGLAGRREDRPTVLMTLCVAGTLAEAEVTLADRGDMNYGMLLGRSFLAGRFWIDPGRERLTRPSCQRRESR
jgi:hypothetical protein